MRFWGSSFKFNFRDDQSKQPASFEAAIKRCELEGHPTPECIAEVFYLFGALEGLRSGSGNPAGTELFLAQVKKQLEDTLNERKQ
jgi:hypothetical protein